MLLIHIIFSTYRYLFHHIEICKSLGHLHVTQLIYATAKCISNCLIQSTAWPNCVKSLTNWFSDQQRTTVFGLFGTSSFVGGILGTAMAVSIVFNVQSCKEIMSCRYEYSQYF